MLPFKKYRDGDGAASTPIESMKRTPDEEQEYDPMESAAEELCHAVAAKDYKAIAAALRAAFELLEESPHQEGPHV